MDAGLTAGPLPALRVAELLVAATTVHREDDGRLAARAGDVLQEHAGARR